MSEKNEFGSCGVVSNGFEWLWIFFHRGEGMTIKSVMIQPPFKLRFIGELPRPLPSPAEKGDREAVDEESICNQTYWGYSYVPTTIRICAPKWLIQLYF